LLEDATAICILVFVSKTGIFQGLILDANTARRSVVLTRHGRCRIVVVVCRCDCFDLIFRKCEICKMAPKLFHFISNQVDVSFDRLPPRTIFTPLVDLTLISPQLFSASL
jgi:hypothetical protein